MSSSSTTTTATLTKQQKKKLAKKRRKRSRKMNLGMNLEKDVLKPLTSEQKSKAYEVKAAYADWWNNRKFTKGWAQPLFTYQEVEQLLERAAEIVVRIRAHLDEINPGMKLRMTDGSAREFLWGQEEHPSKDPEKFVREIIHATLSDGNGYVEGLTKEKIDQYIETIEKYLAQERAGEIEKLEEDVRRNWDEADTLLKELLSKSAEDKKAPQFVQQLQMILGKLGTLTKDMKEIKKGKDRRSLSLSSSSNTPYGARAAPDTAVVPVTSPDAPTEQVKEAEPAAATETPATEEKAAAEPASPAAMEEVPPSPAEPAASATDTAPSETPRTEAEGESPMQVEEKEGAAAAAEEDAEKKAAEEKERQERERLEREEKEKAERAAQREQVRQSGMLKIQRVADDVHSLKGQIQGLSEGANVLDIEHLAKEPESSDKLLDKLQKQCLAYSEGLMKDLLTLDTIISEPELEGEASGEGGDEEPATGVRPMRRKQVKEIQTLLQAVDEVNAKLKAMRSRIQQEKKALEEERRKQEAERKQKEDEEKAKQKEQEQEQQQQQQPQEEEASQSEQGESSEEEKPKKPASATSPPKEHRSPLNEKWKDLKLKPKFEVQQQPQAVVLQAYIPGMNEDDISITLGGDERRGHTLTVSGFRCPTLEEEAALRRQLRAYAQRDPYGLYFPRTEPEDILLLRMGAGRYGSFSETFQLGDTMDHENLSAAYNGGILQITIPRKLPVRKPRPAIPQRGRPYVPAGYPRQSDGFFNDRSFWW